MIKGALIGFGISVLLLTIPIVHFIAGPVGPFIGGLVGGASARAGPAQALGIGLLMGLFMAGPALILTIISQYLSGWAAHFLIFMAIGLVLWETILGSLGALVAAGGGGRTVVRRFRYQR